MDKGLVVRNDMPVMDLGDVLAKSGYFSDAKGAAQAVVKVLAGQELGFGPIASMTGVYIVKGKVSLSANLMAAAIKRSGRYTYKVKTLTEQACALRFLERNGTAWEDLGESGFTIEDAKKAGLTSNDTWAKYPRNMLFARALSNGARWYTPDIFGGPVYTPDELGAPVDGETGEILEGEVISGNGHDPEPAEPEPAPVQQAAATFPPEIQAAMDYHTKKGERLGAIPLTKLSEMLDSINAAADPSAYAEAKGHLETLIEWMTGEREAGQDALSL